MTGVLSRATLGLRHTTFLDHIATVFIHTDLLHEQTANLKLTTRRFEASQNLAVHSQTNTDSVTSTDTSRIVELNTIHLFLGEFLFEWLVKRLASLVFPSSLFHQTIETSLASLFILGNSACPLPHVVFSRTVLVPLFHSTTDTLGDFREEFTHVF